MITTPLVSIIIPSYNHEEYVHDSIISALQQDYKNIEIIVIDDCSRDNSVSVIKDLNRNFNFQFIINEENLGLNNSLNKALTYAKGEYVSIFASDDQITSNKTQLQIDYILSNSLDGLYSNAIILQNNNLKNIQLEDFKTSIIKGKKLEYISTQDFSLPLLQSGMFKKSVFLSAQRIRIDFKSDDWAFMIFIFNNFKIGYLDEPVLHYRIHGNNTHKKYWETFPMRIDVISRLIDDRFKSKAIANILLSQGNYLFNDKKYLFSIKFFISSLIFNFSYKTLLLIIKFIIPRRHGNK